MGESMSLLSNAATWRKQRREFHKFFSVTVSTQWDCIQESGARKLLALLLEDPQQFYEHGKLYVSFHLCCATCPPVLTPATISAFGWISMRVTYGISPKDPHDEALALAVEGADIAVEALAPGKYLVESFPILRYIPPWFPGAGFQRKAATWRRTWGLVRNKAFNDSVAKMVHDKPVPIY